MIFGPRVLERRDGIHNDTVTLFKTCSVTNQEYSVTLTAEQFNMLKSPNCPLIQNALPGFDADQREFLMTGITPDEWKQMFGVEDDEY